MYGSLKYHYNLAIVYTHDSRRNVDSIYSVIHPGLRYSLPAVKFLMVEVWMHLVNQNQADRLAICVATWKCRRIFWQLSGKTQNCL